MLQSEFFNWRGDESESEIKTYSFETSVHTTLALPPLCICICILVLKHLSKAYKFDKSRTLALEIIDTCSGLDATLFLVICN